LASNTNVKINLPNIRTQAGVLISPLDYENILVDGQLVEYVGDVRLCVRNMLKINTMLTPPLSWRIPPSDSDPGSRAYQFVLRSLQLLPTTTDAANALLQPGKDKVANTVTKDNDATNETIPIGDKLNPNTCSGITTEEHNSIPPPNDDAAQTSNQKPNHSMDWEMLPNMTNSPEATISRPEGEPESASSATDPSTSTSTSSLTLFITFYLHIIHSPIS
jgi:hypothetical protein